MSLISASYILHKKHKQPPEVLYRKSKCRNIDKKTPVLKSIFNKVAGFKVSNFIIKTLQHSCFPVNIANF